MFIQQIYTACLSQASYYISSGSVAAIVDPMRDTGGYIKIAAERKETIRYVFLTHFHADFVSGHLELAEKTGAVVVLGPHAKPHYKAFIAEDGESLILGDCEVEVIHTPGHTIESSCFLLYNEQKDPYALFSGDTLFIGDVGRPDLLSGNYKAEELAFMLYDSIRTKLSVLPDNVILYPGHGAGSACGKNLGKETESTIGAQRTSNYAFRLTRQEFIDAVTTNQPFAPPYFFKDAAININGYENLDTVLKQSLKPLGAEAFKNEMAKNALILDTRDAGAFGKEFIKGAINIGLDGQFALWVGTLIEFNSPLLLITEEGEEKRSIVRLARIGFENVCGYLRGGMPAWKEASGDCDSIPTVNAGKWQNMRLKYRPLDVRRRTEYDDHHLPNAVHIPLEELIPRMKELDRSAQYAVYCAGGYRSMIAASILKKNGFGQLINIEGGIAAVKKIYPELIEIKTHASTNHQRV